MSCSLCEAVIASAHVLSGVTVLTDSARVLVGLRSFLMKRDGRRLQWSGSFLNSSRSGLLRQ